MTTYDPQTAPDPAEWLALEEIEQIRLVAAYHKPIEETIQRPQIHFVTHVVVENQIAEKIEVVRETLERLMAEGLDRHDAIHAIGLILIEHLSKLMHAESAEGDPTERYYENLRSLTATSWVRDVS
ncbi:MAG: hypothetical protein HY914_20705 [Desulfomonile tiedjei]|nr:hypothetical protein [Desulfomonile tiedjei]